MKLCPSLAAALFAAALLSPAHAVVRRDDKPDSLYQRLANSAAFNPVGRVEIDYGSGYQAIGTATLFGRDRIISAAHVFDSEALDGAVGVRINFGRNRISTIDFEGTGVVNLNPGYNPVSLRDDVAVAFLDTPMSLTPATLYTGRRLRLDTKITFVGYGNTGTGKTGSTIFSSVKRAGENALGRYVSGSRNIIVDFDQPGTSRFNSLGSPKALRLEGLLGAGDSGGSAWVKVNNRWQLIGINSYGEDWELDGKEDGYGDYSGFVYLDRYVGWVRSLNSPLSRSATSETTPALTLTAVPEPGAVALLTLGGILLLWRRRTRAA